AQQIQFITDSTVFGGKQLLQGNFTGEWVTGYYANNQLMKISIDLTTSNPDFNVDGIFDLNATNEASAIRGTLTGAATSFAGVAGLNLEDLNEVSASNLGIFNNVGATSAITQTISSLAMAIDNINKVASYLGGIEVRINAQENVLKSQITNYKAAISRIEDADVATEQMELIKSQFLQQASLVSLAQANQNPQQFLQLFR
ncbi:MAG TPA: flagellin, partial [Candidatus Kapabacteria bacterium]|nr:flagellin [Candidatus Kapabacteria bacterium]